MRRLIFRMLVLLRTEPVGNQRLEHQANQHRSQEQTPQAFALAQPGERVGEVIGIFGEEDRPAAEKLLKLLAFDLLGLGFVRIEVHRKCSRRRILSIQRAKQVDADVVRILVAERRRGIVFLITLFILIILVFNFQSKFFAARRDDLNARELLRLVQRKFERPAGQDIATGLADLR